VGDEPPLAELVDEPSAAPLSRPVPDSAGGFAALDPSHPAAAPRRASPAYHAWLLGLSVAVIVLAALLNIRQETQVVLPWLGVPLPEICWWRRYLGLDCPGCGLTRCFISMAHGDLAGAWHYHPLGIFLFAALFAHVPYRAVQWWRVRRGLAEWRLPGLAIATWILIALLAAQWVWRMVQQSV
jgi:hypothetical protein